MRNQLITLEELSAKEITYLLDQAARIKRSPSVVKDVLKGKSFALIFEKPSTRTRVSFEVGITSMGGATLYLGPGDIELDVREPTRDVARALSRYLDGAVLRTFRHETVEEFARYFAKPVINGLTDQAHPCQAVADLLTVSENFKSLKGVTITYVGDANNVLNSLLVLGAKIGTNIHFACPKAYSPSSTLLRRVQQMAKMSGARIKAFENPKQAVKGAQVVYTDVWVSMGEEKGALQKRKHFKGFQVNASLMRQADPQAIVLHCLPAHRGEEITSDVLESKASRVFDQAENRLHAQKAVLAYLFKKGKK